MRPRPTPHPLRSGNGTHPNVATFSFQTLFQKEGTGGGSLLCCAECPPRVGAKRRGVSALYVLEPKRGSRFRTFPHGRSVASALHHSTQKHHQKTLFPLCVVWRRASCRGSDTDAPITRPDALPPRWFAGRGGLRAGAVRRRSR